MFSQLLRSPFHLLANLILGLLAASSVAAEDTSETEQKITHHHANNEGTKIHFASMGSGPLVVMIHGFPDYWYSWRHQMRALSPKFRTVALDQRGYNRSDQPRGVESYRVQHLVSDVVAVIKECGEEKAIVVGHDWGGFVAWNVAMTHPDLVSQLIILNLPHPTALGRELANNPKQQANSEYARNFQKPRAHEQLTAEGLAAWVKDADAKTKYVEAFQRSDFEAMVNYYKANYPRPPYREPQGTVAKVKCPVLMFHGLDDWALLPGGLNGTWEFLEKDLTLVTIPGAGHFVQQDKPERISKTILSWLQLQSELE